MQDKRGIWVCNECLQILDRYGHECDWEELDTEDNDVGYGDYGYCVECRESVAELGTGLFIENAIVDCEFTKNGILFHATIST